MKKRKHFFGLLLIFFNTLRIPYGEQSDQVLSPSAEVSLKKAREGIYQEWVHFQIMGRTHTSEERLKIEALHQAITLIDEAMALLGYDVSDLQSFTSSEERKNELRKILGEET